MQPKPFYYLINYAKDYYFYYFQIDETSVKLNHVDL